MVKRSMGGIRGDWCSPCSHWTCGIRGGLGLAAAGMAAALLGMGVDIGVQVNSNSGIPELKIRD